MIVCDCNRYLIDLYLFSFTSVCIYFLYIWLSLSMNRAFFVCVCETFPKKIINDHDNDQKKKKKIMMIDWLIMITGIVSEEKMIKTNSVKKKFYISKGQVSIQI